MTDDLIRANAGVPVPHDFTRDAPTCARCDEAVDEDGEKLFEGIWNLVTGTWVHVRCRLNPLDLVPPLVVSRGPVTFPAQLGGRAKS